MDQAVMPVYACPLCGVDAPHAITGQLQGVLAIRCSNCRNGSLVQQEELQMYQLHWKEELRQILQSLDHYGE